MNHPIEGLMNTAMNSIKDMIDVDTIIGEPISTGIDTLIIPISKVSFGFVAGGSEFKGETINEYSKKEKEEQVQYRLPFGGGSGAGVTIEPVAFIIVNNGNVKLLPVSHDSYLDKLIDYVPDLIEKSSDFLKNMKDKNKCISDLKEKIEENLEEVDDDVTNDLDSDDSVVDDDELEDD